MNQETSRQLTAEFIGTLMLVLVGAGSVVGNPAGMGAIIPAFAHGLILVSIISTFGHISGAHVNPAVSLAMWIGGQMDSQKMILYMVAQFLGGVVACVIMLMVLPEPGQLGQTVPAPEVNELGIVLIEGLLTFFLVSTVYQVAAYGKGGNLAPLLIGMTLAGLILFGGPLTGASLNPARTLGPALLADDMQDLVQVLVYFAAIFGGGAAAAFVHMDTFLPEADASGKKGKKK